MPLSPHHIPLSRSLRDKVLNDFHPADSHTNTADTLTSDEIAAFLRRSNASDDSPLTTINRCAVRQNRNPGLDPEDHATLLWVCAAFSDWESHFPLESRLRGHAHRLLPLAVALAVRDESFFTPGEHPLHALLDELQHGAVGWQARLDRAGQMLEQRVERAVEKCLEWFNDKQTDIAAIARELVAANERDAARAQRMVQRLAETEGARLKALAARRDAAREINESLANYQLPVAIGDFLKGPWFDSAQLVLSKHGSKSRAWEQMRKAAHQLMESVQKPAGDLSTERDRQEQMLHAVPRELRRWLLSIEHDSDATDSAIGLVEYVHLRLQRGQSLQLVNIPPLKLAAESPGGPHAGGEVFENGGWYRFNEEQGELRAQLVLQLEGSEHLLFTNCVGLKALDLPSAIFGQRLRDGFAVPLPNQCSFSLSLATAAGLDSDEKLDVFTGKRPQPKQREPAPEETVQHSQHKNRIADTPARETTPAAPPTAGPGPAELKNPPEEESTDADTTDATSTDDDTGELILELDAEPEAAIPRRAKPSPAVSPTKTAPIRDSGGDLTTAREPGSASSDDFEPFTDVPMGAWLGFHDGDTPLMAKLAVYDPKREQYIFVNRKGIALREVDRKDFLAMIDQGLVDILETKSYFRDEVKRARETKP